MTLQILFGLMSVTLWLYNCWFLLKMFENVKNKMLLSLLIECFILSIPLIFIMGILGVIIQFFIMMIIGNNKIKRK